MHVIVGQGQLDQVLHATAEERRGFIEEAAGILKHRRRKEKTLRKLEAMQANLTRLSDLAGEIRRQLKPLGQQAEIAREAQQIAAIVRDARARLLADEVVELRALDRRRQPRRERAQDRAPRAAGAARSGRSCGRARIEQTMSGDAVDDARRVAFGLEQVQEHLRSLYTLANQRLALLGQQAELPGHDHHDLAAHDRGGPRGGRAPRGGRRRGRGGARPHVGRRWRPRRAASTRSTRRSASRAPSSRSTTSSRAGSTACVDAAESRRAATQVELERSRTALEEAEQRREDARAELLALEGADGARLGGRRRSPRPSTRPRRRSHALQAEVETLRDELHASERERDALAARTGALSLAVDQKDGSGTIVGRARASAAWSPSTCRCAPGYEAAIAAALGSLADAVLADDRDAALAALASVRSGDAGRVEIVVADAAAAEAARRASGRGRGRRRRSSPRPTACSGCWRASSSSTTSTPRAPPGRRSRKLGDLTVITREGDVLTEHVLRGGSGAGRSKLELVAERDAAQERLVEVTTAIERRKFALAEKREALDLAQIDAGAGRRRAEGVRRPAGRAQRGARALARRARGGVRRGGAARRGRAAR